MKNLIQEEEPFSELLHGKLSLFILIQGQLGSINLVKMQENVQDYFNTNCLSGHWKKFIIL